MRYTVAAVSVRVLRAAACSVNLRCNSIAILVDKIRIAGRLAESVIESSIASGSLVNFDALHSGCCISSNRLEPQLAAAICDVFL